MYKHAYVYVMLRGVSYMFISFNRMQKAWSYNILWQPPLELEMDDAAQCGLGGQRVICAHWKRVICAHCKRVIRAQRNRVIRAQRAVIRAHWCWEPAISGLVGVGGGGGVGWDDNVHVPMHTQAQQPHHLSSRRAETGTALSWSVTGGVGWVMLVVRWAEIREMSCVSCEMSGLVWDELCELWDESCERTWVKFSERTRSSSTKCHTKAALERVELCEMSWVRCVVWDELCDLWDERSCVRWNVCIVWDNLSEVERERSNSGGEGWEGKEYKHKNKSPTQRCEEKNHNLMSCVMMLKKS